MKSTKRCGNSYKYKILSLSLGKMRPFVVRAVSNARICLGSTCNIDQVSAMITQSESLVWPSRAERRIPRLFNVVTSVFIEDNLQHLKHPRHFLSESNLISQRMSFANIANEWYVLLDKCLAPLEDLEKLYFPEHGPKKLSDWVHHEQEPEWDSSGHFGIVSENEAMAGVEAVTGTGEINQKESRKIARNGSGKKNRNGPAKRPRTRIVDES